MIDTQQQYIKLNIRGEISIIGVQAHSGRKRDILVFTKTGKSGNVIQMVYEKACVVFYATELQNFNGKLVSMKSPVA